MTPNSHIRLQKLPALLTTHSGRGEAAARRPHPSSLASRSTPTLCNRPCTSCAEEPKGAAVWAPARWKQGGRGSLAGPPTPRGPCLRLFLLLWNDCSSLSAAPSRAWLRGRRASGDSCGARAPDPADPFGAGRSERRGWAPAPAARPRSPGPALLGGAPDVRPCPRGFGTSPYPARVRVSRRPEPARARTHEWEVGLVCVQWVARGRSREAGVGGWGSSGRRLPARTDRRAPAGGEACPAFRGELTVAARAGLLSARPPVGSENAKPGQGEGGPTRAPRGAWRAFPLTDSATQGWVGPTVHAPPGAGPPDPRDSGEGAAPCPSRRLWPIRAGLLGSCSPLCALPPLRKVPGRLGGSMGLSLNPQCPSTRLPSQSVLPDPLIL